MRCWVETGNDPYSSLVFFDKGRAERILGLVPRLGMLSIIGTRISGMDDAEEFKQACFTTLDKWLRNEKFESYKLYLYVSHPVRNPKSRVSRYKKVWRILQQSWDLDDFVLSSEIEIMSKDTLHFAGIAECTLDILPQALTIMMSQSHSFLFASKRSGVLDEDQIESLHNKAFVLSREYPDYVDTFNLCLHLCPQGDLVFRWGDASEESQLDLIFAKK